MSSGSFAKIRRDELYRRAKSDRVGKTATRHIDNHNLRNNNNKNDNNNNNKPHTSNKDDKTKDMIINIEWNELMV